MYKSMVHRISIQSPWPVESEVVEPMYLAIVEDIMRELEVRKLVCVDRQATKSYFYMRDSCLYRSVFLIEFVVPSRRGRTRRFATMPARIYLFREWLEYQHESSVSPVVSFNYSDPAFPGNLYNKLDDLVI